MQQSRLMTKRGSRKPWQVVVLTFASTTLASTIAAADPCTVKVLQDEVAVQVRICDVVTSEQCDAVLFEGELQPGDEQVVDLSGDRLVYEAFNPETGSYDPRTTALCSDGVVEL